MAFRDSHYSLGGTVEADKIFIGGKQSLKEIGEFGSNKTPFLIMVEENNHGGPRFLTFEELESIYEQHVVPALEKHITKGSRILVKHKYYSDPEPKFSAFQTDLSARLICNESAHLSVL